MNIIDELSKLNVGEVINDACMKDHTTYKVGGKVIAMVLPFNEEELITLLRFVSTNKIKYKVIGKGSNVVFNDKGYDGVIIKLDHFDKFEINKNTITIGAGYSLIKAAMRLSRLGYTGLEFATGIPGSIGGAIYMNAGAYNSDMGYVVKEVKVLTPNYTIKKMSNSDLNFHYRSSFFQKNPGYICLETTLFLKKGNPNTIMDMIEDRKKRRLATQPLEFPSAGSVFRNPPDMYAGKLIEELGYKGRGYNDAVISEKHANFVINKGHATGEDIKKLILEIREQVKDKYGVELVIEQEFVE